MDFGWWFFFYLFNLSSAQEIFDFHEMKDCTLEEYYDNVTFSCKSCGTNEVRDFAGFGCRCKEGSFKSLNDSVCTPCLSPQLIYNEQECLPCYNDSSNADFCICPLGHGLFKNSLGFIECIPCGNSSQPNENRWGCSSCGKYFELNQDKKCVCMKNYVPVGRECIQENLVAAFSQSDSLYSVNYPGLGNKKSTFFEENIYSLLVHCIFDGDQKTCSMLINLCVLSHLNFNEENSVCNYQHKIWSGRFDYRLAQLNVKTHSQTLPSKAMSLYFYPEHEASVILSRTSIPIEYSMVDGNEYSSLELYSSKTSLNGTYLSFRPVNVLDILLCSGTESVLKIALKFGYQVRKSCVLTVADLVRKPSVFMELYLHYYDNTQKSGRLINVPILDLDHFKNGHYINKDNNVNEWQLTKRFFLVDKSGIKNLDGQGTLQYAERIELKIELQESSPGRIYVPYLLVKYNSVTISEALDNATVDCFFSVSYSVDYRGTFEQIRIAIGVVSAFAILWSVIQVWSWAKRNGQAAVDYVVILKLIFFVCHNISYTLVFVVGGSCVYLYIFYKYQSVVHTILPDESQEYPIRDYIITAFVLQVVSMANVIYEQVVIDIFFIDWEKPKADNVHVCSNSRFNCPSNTKQNDSVSIWRTYLVANEWSKIQSLRKISLPFQIFILLFILEVCGLKYFSLTNPAMQFDAPEEYWSPYSLPCRVALVILIYVLTALLQWFYSVVFYERFIQDSLSQFVDLCSLCNISIFVLFQENFGFYIHGRSTHGQSDTDLKSIHEQLKREEEDLCGHRGLVPSTDHQTFTICLPRKLRQYYRKVLFPLGLRDSKMRSFGRKSKFDDVEAVSIAYQTMNRFLISFLDHALKDLDYIVSSKTVLERLFDLEFEDDNDVGVFYIDSSHSFEAVMFHGIELRLLILELLLFLFTDMFAQDFLVSGLVTLICSKLIEIIRITGGKRNLAKKTLIDDRFFA